MFSLNLSNFITHKYFSFNEYVVYDHPKFILPPAPSDKPYTLARKPDRSNVSKLPSNSIFLDTPKHQSCTILILHFFLLKSSPFLLQQLNSKFNRPCHFLYQKNCNTLCDPNVNWHIFLSLNDPSNSPNTKAPDSQLTIPLNTYIRNAIFYNSTFNETSILVRFEWIPLNPEIPSEENFTTIQLISNQRKQNLELAKCPLILPFKFPDIYRYRQPWSLLRSEPYSTPGITLHYRVSERLNATLTMQYVQLGKDLMETISTTPNAMTGMYGITAERLLIVDYSCTLAVSKLNFVTGLPKRVGYSFAFLFKPLTFWIWINIWSSFLVLTISLKLLFSSKLKTNEVVFAFLLPLFDQSITGKFWRMHSKHYYLFITRFMIITWLFSCLLLSNLYRSFITGYLIQPSMEIPPQTFHELATSGYSLLYQESSQNNVKQAIFSSINHLAKSNQSHRFISLNTTQVILGVNYLFL